MKRLLVLAFASSVAALGCSGGGSSTPYTSTTPAAPSSATSTPAPASPTTSSRVFTMQLAASNETPAVSNAEAGANGTATITLKTTKDGSGAVTAATADFQVSLAALAAGSQLTMAHIHLGGGGVAGAILVSTGLSSGDAPVVNGSASFQKTAVNVPADVAQAMLNTAGNYYFNVHTALNPNGVVRGQLDGSSAAPTTPDPNPNPYGKTR